MLLPVFRTVPTPAQPDVPMGYIVTLSRGQLEGATVFHAQVRELPDVVEFAETAEAAFALAIDAIRTTAEMFAERGRAMPPATNIGLA